MVADMALEAVALWWLLLVVTRQLGRDPEAADAAPSLGLDRPTRLAARATALVLGIVPLGVLYGPLLTRYAERLFPLH